MTHFPTKNIDRSTSGVGSYMDGVQLRIGERFKQSQRITLPINYIERNANNNDFSRFEYNFELENSVLRKAEERRLQEEQNKLKEKQKIALQSEMNNANSEVKSVSNENGQRAEAGSHQVSNGLAQEPVLMIQPRPAMLGMDILTPTPLANAANAPKTTVFEKPLIDLADFESRATDPFEMTELKTLNDMEELRSVLEQTLPTSDTTLANDTQPTRQGRQEEEHTTESELVVEPIHNNVDQAPQYTIPVEMNTSGEANGGMMNYPAASTTPYPILQNPSQQTSNTPAYVYKEDSFARRTPLPPISPNCQNYADTYQDPDIEDDKYIINFNRTGMSTTSNIDSVSCRAGTSMGVVEVPPSFPMNLNKYSCLPPKSASPALQSDDPQQHPLFMSLDTEKQHFVKSIAAMGFPLLRVAKVVERNGCDSELVVETLCAIQRLCDKGYLDTKVEDVLNLVDNDEQKASEFLRLINQFETLGFQTEDIKKQLIVVGTDEDKILDALTKTS